jgi:hypothetical protein
MRLRHVLALLMAATVALGSSSAGPSVLGAVLEANCAHLDRASVSAGATVYDGDRFSTETGGLLLMRGKALMLELAADSNAAMRSKTNGAQGMETELTRGTLVFSTARATALEVIARGAHVQPAKDERTVAQVSVTGPKELRIYARRGALRLSYKWQSETIAEGAAFRVILDPPEDDSSKTQPAARPKKAFVLIVIGAVLGPLIYELHEAFESADRP